MTKKRKISSILRGAQARLAGTEREAEISVVFYRSGKFRPNARLKYTCWAVYAEQGLTWTPYGGISDENYVIKFLKEIGLPSAYQIHDPNATQEEMQAWRFMFLEFAILMAKEQGL